MDLQRQQSELEKLRRVWQALAEDDPMWAVLSTPEKRGGKWNQDEFFETGVQDVQALIHTLATHGIRYSTRAALDFGCGLGRLTQALTPYFDVTYGVDISSEMIRRAKAINTYGSKCCYLLNVHQHLRIFSDHQLSFIYSTIVLQHVPPDLSELYLREFLRILEPGGLLVFQLPSCRIGPNELAPDAFSARIQLWKPPLSFLAKTHHRIAVTVQNTSPSTWKSNPWLAISLGNHWLDQMGNMTRMDDGRTTLPNRVDPGEIIELTLEVTAPSCPGVYVLELDLVQEGISWFAQRGSATTRCVVEVGASPDPARAVQDLSAPVTAHQPDGSDKGSIQDLELFGMHCIHRSRILEVIQDAGGYLDYIHPTDCAPGFLSYVYYVRKCSLLHV